MHRRLSAEKNNALPGASIDSYAAVIRPKVAPGSSALSRSAGSANRLEPTAIRQAPVQISRDMVYGGGSSGSSSSKIVKPAASRRVVDHDDEAPDREFY